MEKKLKKRDSLCQKKKMKCINIKKEMICVLLAPFFFVFFFCKQTLCSLMEEFQSYFLLIMLWRPKNGHQVSLPYIGMSQQDTFAQS